MNGADKSANFTIRTEGDATYKTDTTQPFHAVSLNIEYLSSDDEIPFSTSNIANRSKLVYLADQRPQLSTGQGAKQTITQFAGKRITQDVDKKQKDKEKVSEVVYFDTDGIHESSTNGLRSMLGLESFNGLHSKWKTYVRIPSDGVYEFSVNSKDATLITEYEQSSTIKDDAINDNNSPAISTKNQHIFHLKQGDVVKVKLNYKTNEVPNVALKWKKIETDDSVLNDQDILTKLNAVSSSIVPGADLFLSERAARNPIIREDDSVGTPIEIYSTQPVSNDIEIRSKTSHNVKRQAHTPFATRQLRDNSINGDDFRLQTTDQSEDNTIGVSSAPPSVGIPSNNSEARRDLKFKQKNGLWTDSSLYIYPLKDKFAEDTEKIGYTIIKDKEQYRVDNASGTFNYELADSGTLELSLKDVIHTVEGQGNTPGCFIVQPQAQTNNTSDENSNNSTLRFKYSIDGSRASSAKLNRDYLAPLMIETLGEGSSSPSPIVDASNQNQNTCIFITPLKESIDDDTAYKTVDVKIEQNVITDNTGFKFRWFNIKASQDTAQMKIYNDQQDGKQLLLLNPLTGLLQNHQAINAIIDDQTGNAKLDFVLMLARKPKKNQTVNVNLTLDGKSKDLVFNSQNWDQFQPVVFGNVNSEEISKLNILTSTSRSTNTGRTGALLRPMDDETTAGTSETDQSSVLDASDQASTSTADDGGDDDRPTTSLTVKNGFNGLGLSIDVIPVHEVPPIVITQNRSGKRHLDVVRGTLDARGNQSASFDVRLGEKPINDVNIEVFKITADDNPETATLVKTITVPKQDWNKNKRITIESIESGHLNDFQLVIEGSDEQQLLSVAPYDFEGYIDINIKEGADAQEKLPTLRLSSQDGKPGSNSRAGFEFKLSKLATKDIVVPVSLTDVNNSGSNNFPSEVTVFAGTSSAFLPVEVDTDDQISGVRRFDLEVHRNETSDFSIRRSRRKSSLRIEQNLEPSILIAVDNQSGGVKQQPIGNFNIAVEDVLVREGSTTEFEITLNSRPSDDVTVQLNVDQIASDGRLRFDRKNVVITPDNYDQWKKISVAGEVDGIFREDRTINADLIATSNDQKYNNLTRQLNFKHINVDPSVDEPVNDGAVVEESRNDDTPLVFIQGGRSTIVEGGQPRQYKVRLTEKAHDDVLVRIDIVADDQSTFRQDDFIFSSATQQLGLTRSIRKQNGIEQKDTINDFSELFRDIDKNDSIEVDGFVEIPTSGSYTFKLENFGNNFNLQIDGQSVEMLGSGAANSSLGHFSAPIQLRQGLLPIAFTSTQQRGVKQATTKLSWNNEDQQVVGSTPTFGEFTPEQILQYPFNHVVIPKGDDKATFSLAPRTDDETVQADQRFSLFPTVTDSNIEEIFFKFVEVNADDNLFDVSVVGRRNQNISRLFNEGDQMTLFDDDNPVYSFEFLDDVNISNSSGVARARGELSRFDDDDRSEISASEFNRLPELLGQETSTEIQAEDREVGLTLNTLTPDRSSSVRLAREKNDDEFFRTEITLNRTNIRRGVFLEKGTRLDFQLDEDGQPFQLALDEDIRLRSGQTRTVRTRLVRGLQDIDLEDIQCANNLVYNFEPRPANRITIKDNQKAQINYNNSTENNRQSKALSDQGDRKAAKDLKGQTAINVVEGDSTNGFDITLDTKPSANVYMSFEAACSDLTISSVTDDDIDEFTTLVFTPDNWDQPQSLLIEALDDDIVNGDRVCNVFSRIVSNDPVYDERGENTSTARNIPYQSYKIIDNDNPVINIELSQISLGLNANEFIDISLDAQPENDVDITFNSSDQLYLNGNPVGVGQTLTFTPENYDVSQILEVKAFDDALYEGDSTEFIDIQTSSDDADFDGLNVESIEVNLIDDDEPTASIEAVLDATEHQEPGVFAITLDAPLPNKPGDQDLAVNYQVSSVRIDPSTQELLGPNLTDADLRQLIAQSPTTTTQSLKIGRGDSKSTSFAVPIDNLIDQEQDNLIVIQLLDGDGYQVDQNHQQATVKFIDNDEAGIVVMTSGTPRVQENGGQSEFLLALATQPTSDVTVDLLEAPIANRFQLGRGRGDVLHSVTFTPSDWNTAQVLKFSARNDKLIEDNLNSNSKRNDPTEFVILDDDGNPRSSTDPSRTLDRSDLAFTGIHPANLKFNFRSDDSNYNSGSQNQLDDSNHFVFTEQAVEVVDFMLPRETADVFHSSFDTLQESLDNLSFPIFGSLAGRINNPMQQFGERLLRSIKDELILTPLRVEKIVQDEIRSLIVSGMGDAQSLLGDVDIPITVVQENDDIRIDVGFGDDYSLLSVPLPLDFGIPGFNFQSRGSVDASFDYESQLSIVFPSSAGPYIDTTPDKTSVNATLTTQLSQESDSSEAFKLTGGLGFMQLDAVNQPTVNPNVTIGDSMVDGTQLTASFDLDLNHQNGMGNDGQLSLNEMIRGDQPLVDAFQYQFSGDAAMSFGVTTSVNGSAAIPSLKFDLSSGFEIFNYNNLDDSSDSDDDESKETDIYFDNIRLDLGTFITNMARPIVNQVDELLKPIYPVNDALNGDTFIFGRMGLTDQFDRNSDGQVSPIELAVVFADFMSQSSPNNRRARNLLRGLEATELFLNTMNSVIGLVRDLRSVSESENFYVDFGDYKLSDFRADDADAVIPDAKDSPSDDINLNTDTQEQAQRGGTPDDQNDSSDSEPDSGSSTFGNIMNRLDQLGFNIPLLDDPFTAVNLLLDRPVDLFTWTMPDMAMEAGVEQSFPIWGPLQGLIRGGLTADAAFGFGYDTHGLREWANSSFDLNQAHRAFDGFYVSDRNSDDQDIDEFGLTANMNIGPMLSTFVADVAVTGGLEAGASLDLLDVGEIAGTDDGRIRTHEIQERIHNPLELFEFTGGLSATVDFLVRVFTATVYESRLATVPLFEFAIGGSSGVSAQVLNGPPTDSSNGITYLDQDGDYQYEDDVDKKFNDLYLSTSDGADFRDVYSNENAELTAVALGYKFADGRQKFPFIAEFKPDHLDEPLTISPLSTFSAFFHAMPAIFGIDKKIDITQRNYIDQLKLKPSSLDDQRLVASNAFLTQLGGEMINLLDRRVDGFFGDNFNKQRIEVIELLGRALKAHYQSNPGTFSSSDFRKAIAAMSVEDLESITDAEIKFTVGEETIDQLSDFAADQHAAYRSFLENTGKSSSFKDLKTEYFKAFNKEMISKLSTAASKQSDNNVSDAQMRALEQFGVDEDSLAAFSDYVNDLGQDAKTSRSKQGPADEGRPTHSQRPSSQTVDRDLFNSRANTAATASFPESITLSASGPGRSQTTTNAKRILNDFDVTDSREHYPTIRRFFNSLDPDSNVYVQSLNFSGVKDDDALINIDLSSDDPETTVSALLIDTGSVDNERPRLVGDHIDLLLIDGTTRFRASDQNNRISGDGFEQRIVAGKGDDHVLAGSGADRVRGNQGNDILHGNGGSDRLMGGRQADFLRGGRASDRLHGGRQNDQLQGDGGSDRLFGNSGDDRLTGGRQEDRLFGGGGVDRLFGGPDNDYLDGGRRHDQLSGGTGSDVFALSRGRDVITDFDLSQGDTLVLDPIRFKESLELEQICQDLLLRTDDGLNTLIADMNLNTFKEFYPVYQTD
ncbi:hypothetical protein KR100_08810 [Synechococcus sp. KORDI-100]|nr:hypothetical protein KR100_08810 [Synechococcus sp. KORDI-100]